MQIGGPEFVVPELPLGTILGVIGMFAAFGIFRYITQKRFHF